MSREDRGVSEVIGYVLLVGVVTGGITAVLLLGGSAVSDIKGDAQAESGTNAFAQADSRIAGLSGSQVNETEFQLRGADPGRVRTYDNASSGHIRIAVDGGACSTQLPLSTVEYEREDGGTVGLQAGGRFASSPDGESSVVTAPPSLSADRGTVSVTTYDLHGFVDDERVRITKNATATRSQSATLDDALLGGPGSTCNRPDSATITVQSRYYDGWGDYLETETGLPVTTDASAETATVTIPQSWLPQRTDDSINRVIDLSDPNMATVESDGAPTSASSYTQTSSADSISVGKGTNNTYSVSAVPLGNGTQSSRIELVASETVSRQPVDVVFVVDESGSMSWGGPDGTDKYIGARRAARDFVDDLNTSTDRAALVGFDNTGDARYIRIGSEEQYFSSDHDAIKNAINDTRHSGGTAAFEGMRRANTLHDLAPRSDAQKVIILLTDGANTDSPNNPSYYGTSNADTATRNQAERAARNNVTVYTVGFGGGNTNMLEDVATTTGGQYRFASNSSELNTVFQDILTDITSVRAIVHEPTTAQVSVGGETVRPQLGYDNPDINQVSGSYDINDPEYRGGFDFSARASDGNLVDITATSYDCEDNAFETTDVLEYNSTENRTYTRVRCTDIDESSGYEVENDETSIYLDGADVSELPNTDESWYQDDLVNDTLAGYVDGNELDLASNEAIVVFQYDTGSTEGRMVMLYQVGLPHEQTVTDVFDVRTVNATVG